MRIATKLIASRATKRAFIACKGISRVNIQRIGEISRALDFGCVENVCVIIDAHSTATTPTRAYREQTKESEDAL
jgi:hypothetical protein